MDRNQTKTSERTDTFIELYRQCFPIAARYIRKNGGNLEDAEDIFHDALIVFYEQKRIEPTISNGYLIGICRNIWLKKLRDEPGITSLDNDLPVQEGGATISIPMISNFLENAGKRCKDILVSFYYEKVSLEKIASQFGFKSVRSATVQKFKCIEKLRSLAKEKQLEYADFTE